MYGLFQVGVEFRAPSFEVSIAGNYAHGGFVKKLLVLQLQENCANGQLTAVLSTVPTDTPTITVLVMVTTHVPPK